MFGGCMMFGGWWESMFGELEIILDGPRLWGTLMESCFKVLAGRSGFRDSSLWHVFKFLSSDLLDWLRLSYLALSVH
jgi:hypothetical protein